MIRVCHVITDLNAGGAERMLVNVVTRLDRSQFQNQVISLIEPGLMADELKAADIPVASLGMRRGQPSLGGLVALVGQLRRSRPAIVQSWLYHADFAATLASWATPRTSLIWNLRCSDLPDQPGTGRLHRLVRWLAWMSAAPKAVVVNSTKGEEFHRAFGYRPRRWALIPNGVDANRFRPRPNMRVEMRRALGISSDATVIGLVARFHPMKDFPTFLAAADAFARIRENVRFVVCGEGFDSGNGEVTAMIAERGLADRAILLGARSDIENIYPVFDVLTLSSAYGEGFPNVLIEAMACGVPCVTTEVGDSQAIVADSGIVVRPGDPEALMRGWETVTVVPQPQQFGARARSRVLEHYSIDRVCLLYESLYRELSTPSQPRRIRE